MARGIARTGIAAALVGAAATACAAQQPPDAGVDATPIEEIVREPAAEETGEPGGTSAGDVQSVSPRDDGVVTAAGTVEVLLDGAPVRFDIGLDLEIGWVELDDSDVLGKIASLTIDGDVDVMLFVADAIASPEPGPVDPLDADSDPVEQFRTIAEQTHAYTIDDVERPNESEDTPRFYVRLSEVDDEVPLFYVVARDDPSAAAALSIEPDAETDTSHVWLTWLDDRWIGLIAGVEGDGAQLLDDAMGSLRTP